MTAVVSLFAKEMTAIWYGIGTFVGAFSGWIIAYFRLRWVERNLDEHIFCRGSLIPSKFEKLPSNIVYPIDMAAAAEKNNQKRRKKP